MKRGQLTLWFDTEAVAAWRHPGPFEGRGRPKVYADAAIQCALVLNSVFHLNLRTTQGFLQSIVALMSLPSRSVVRFYNKRGTAEQWIKEGKQATHWTRLSCHRFRANEVRLQLSVLAYNLGNLWRRLGLPNRIKSWSLTSLQHRLMKTGGRLVKHARYYWLLLAEGHLNRRLFGDMLHRIWALPLPSG